MKLTIFLLCLINLVWAQATFKHVKGDVYKYKEVNNPEKVSKGDTFEENETIVLKENAQVVIKLADHSVQRVEGPSEFKFESFAYTFEDSDEVEKPANLLMETGTFFIKVLKKSDNESMLIKTKQTTFGIRGTEFLLDVPEDKDMILSIHEGAVEVLNDEQNDIIEKGASLFIENDKTFKKLNDNELRKEIDWKFDGLVEKKQKFRELRQARREKIRENLRKWNRDELKWSKFKEKRAKKIEKWKERTSNLKTNQKLKRKELRKELRQKRREENRKKRSENQDFSSNEFQKKRDALRQKKIEELKKRQLENSNSFMNEDQRKLRRQRNREEMIRRRRLESKPPSTTNSGEPGEN